MRRFLPPREGNRSASCFNLCARALLEAADADRAGLWLSGDRRGEAGTGCVAEAAPGPIPEQWKRLDVSTPFLRAALENPDPLHVEFIAGETAPRLGPLIGMHSAVWIPLRERGRTFGLAMVGYARPPGELDLDALRARADEITLAVQHHRSSRRNELAAEERRAQLRLSRAILCGVSADSILPRIARAARHYAQAEFIALGPGKRASHGGRGMGRRGRVADSPASGKSRATLAQCFHGRAGIRNSGRSARKSFRRFGGFSAIRLWNALWPFPLKSAA